MEYWQPTLQMLQPVDGGKQLISKPVLKPDLLQTVPFKFLHDVIVGVRKSTTAQCPARRGAFQRLPVR